MAKVFIFCEYSGVVLEAFLAEGHDAYSADLLPTESIHKDRHYQGDGRWLLREPWDLVIAHPPCQYLSVARGRIRDLDKAWDAIDLFTAALKANAPKVAVENPTIYKFARHFLGEPDQKVQPWQFGDGYVKTTWLWLKGLPPLLPLYAGGDSEWPLLVQSSGANYKSGRKGHGGHRSPALRAKFHPGMAAAMARQWGNYPG